MLALELFHSAKIVNNFMVALLGDCLRYLKGGGGGGRKILWDP